MPSDQLLLLVGWLADPVFVLMNMVAPESPFLPSHHCGSPRFTEHNGQKATGINTKAQAVENAPQDQSVVTQK